MQKLVLTASAAVLIAGSAGFYGGSLYQKRTDSARSPFGMANGTVRPGDDRAQRFGGESQGFRQTGTNFVAGEVLAKDDSSITVKLRDGGSRIVFISESTAISKSTQGSKDDLAVGGTVMVTGTTGTDGIMSAQSISLGSEPIGTVPPANP